MTHLIQMLEFPSDPWTLILDMALEKIFQILRMRRRLDSCSALHPLIPMVLLLMTSSTSRMSIFTLILLLRMFPTLKQLLKMIASCQPSGLVPFEASIGLPTRHALAAVSPRSTFLNFEVMLNPDWWMTMCCAFASWRLNNPDLEVTSVQGFVFFGPLTLHHESASCFISVLQIFAEKWPASCMSITLPGTNKILSYGIFVMAISYIWKLLLNKVNQLQLPGVTFKAMKALNDKGGSLPMQAAALDQRTLMTLLHLPVAGVGQGTGDPPNLMLNLTRYLLHLPIYKKMRRMSIRYYKLEDNKEDSKETLRTSCTLRHQIAPPSKPSICKVAFLHLRSLFVTSHLFTKPEIWSRVYLGFW